MDIREIVKYGFIFPGARRFVNGNANSLAQDAALITAPNSIVPIEFTAYLDPKVIDILTAPRNARELFSEVKKGDWTTSYEKFRVNEMTGRTVPYADYGNGGGSNVNYNWLARQQYIFQTLIIYGDYEVAVSSAARINLATDKQRSAANTISIDSNKFYLLGVLNREIYGFLNEPNLPPAITAAPTGAGGSTSWSSKDTEARYNDVLDLFSQLVTQSQGWISKDSALTLVMSPAMAVKLASATAYNVSVFDMLNKYFRSLRIVTLAEISSVTAGETMIMYANEVQGMPVAEMAYSEKMRAGRVVPQVSSFEQKYTGTTYGCILYLPFAVAQMTGM